MDAARDQARREAGRQPRTNRHHASRLAARIARVILVVAKSHAMSVYNYSAPLLNCEHTSLSHWRGRVLLIVNTASHCGFTPQYSGLQRLHERLERDGLTVLGFPCNQFLNQELGSESEITRFCRENFGVTFPMFSRLKVNGRKAHPLFRH